MDSVAQFSWDALLEATHGKAVSAHKPFSQVSINTDTRTVGVSSFFLPIVGERFDGHDYIETAYAQGIQGAFTSHQNIQNHPTLARFPNLISIENPLEAYWALANYHRKQCPAQIVAITGSSGKTTTKEMLFTQLVSALGESAVQKTEKNFNNEIGVPLTLLNLKPSTQVMVVEMAMRGLRQIAPLSLCAQPDIALITNIGPAHIGLLGSIQAITQAKCEIFEGLSKEGGLAIINADDPLLVKEASKYWPGAMETFSLHEVENIHNPKDGGLRFDYQGVTFHLGVPGSHNVMNTLAGIKVCEALGIPLQKIGKALAEFEAGDGRWQKTPIAGGKNLWVINDAYNANPTSMKMALGAFVDTPFEDLHKIAVVGAMSELGEYSQQYHQEVGEWLNHHNNITGLIIVGEEAKPIMETLSPQNIEALWFATPAEAAKALTQNWPEDAIYFLKASRSMRLEEIPVEIEQMLGSHALS